MIDVAKAKSDLVALRELLSDPSRWTTGRHARDINGNTVIPTSPSALCWCLMGGMHKIGIGWDAFAIINNRVGGFVAKFNDEKGHQAVLDLIDKSINDCSLCMI